MSKIEAWKRLGKVISRILVEIWRPVKRWSQIGQDKKTLISSLTFFFTAMEKIVFLETRMATGHYVSTQIWDFL